MEELITKLQEFFLLHSFLYYEMHSAYISDNEFEKKCRMLICFQRDNPNSGKYWSLTKELDNNYSAEVMGLSGKGSYPAEIRMSAYRHVYLDEVNKYDEYPYTFEEYCNRNGFE